MSDMSIRQAAGRIAGAALLAVMAGILSLHGATGAAAAAINPFVMAPSFTLSTLNLTFFTGVGVNPAPQTVTLKTGSSPVRWTTSVDQPWLIVNPKQGNTRPNPTSAALACACETICVSVVNDFFRLGAVPPGTVPSNFRIRPLLPTAQP